MFESAFLLVVIVVASFDLLSIRRNQLPISSEFHNTDLRFKGDQVKNSSKIKERKSTRQVSFGQAGSLEHFPRLNIE
jgi:hypothetical protein